MSRRSTIISNWPKYLLQWGGISAIIIFFTGIVPELNQAVENLSVEVVPAAETGLVEIAKGLGLAAVIVLFSKLFCAYLCPSGAVQDILMKLHKPLRIKKLNIPNRSIADLILRIIKYGLTFLVISLFLTGFESRPALWMTMTGVGVMVLGSFIVDRFWCRYICPAGALINSLKFWMWMLIPIAIYGGLRYFGIIIPWEIPLGVMCLMAYLLEIIDGKQKMQILYVMKDEMACTHCHTCLNNCPYHINIKPCLNGKVRSVDCNLCGECVTSCPSGALNFGVRRISRRKFWKFIPALLLIAIVIFAIWATGNL